MPKAALKKIGAQSRAPRARKPVDPEQEVMAVLKQFRIVFRSVKRHFQWVEAQCGVSGAQLWALGKVGESPGLKVSELAKALAIHQSTASNMLDRLEQLGLIRRERISSDQRVVHLYLTPKGKKVLASAPQPFQGVLPDALAALPDPVLAALHRHLTTLIATMKVKDSSGQETPLSDM
jgi:MarR family transcriptional regulator, organic hydroperoxide resistance regulator